jgi:hypothetical protein
MHWIDDPIDSVDTRLRSIRLLSSKRDVVIKLQMSTNSNNIPSEVTAKLLQYGNEATLTPRISYGNFLGYMLTVTVNRSPSIDFNGKVTWTFDTDGMMTAKEVSPTLPEWDAKLVASDLLDDKRVEFEWRNPTSLVEERVAKLGETIVSKSWHWSVPETLHPTSLAEELDIVKTKLQPTELDLPSTSGYNKGERSLPAGFPTNIRIEWNARTDLMKDLLSHCQKNGLLRYSNIDDIKETGNMDVNEDNDDYNLRLWKENEEAIIHDNNTFRDGATNKQRRFFAYKQFTWLIHGKLSKGERKELPKYITDKIRQQWPEEDGKYTGFREAK